MTKYIGDSFLGEKEFSYTGGRNINWYKASLMLLDNMKTLNAYIIWPSGFAAKNVHLEQHNCSLKYKSLVAP